MTAKEYLERVKLENIKITQKMEQMELLQQAATSTGIDLSMDRVQSSSADGIPEIVMKYLRLEEEIEQEIEERESIRNEVINAIHELNDEKQIKVLYEKWIKGRKVEDIASDFPYTVKHTWRIYTEAMKNIEKIIIKY